MSFTNLVDDVKKVEVTELNDIDSNPTDDSIVQANTDGTFELVAADELIDLPDAPDAEDDAVTYQLQVPASGSTDAVSWVEAGDSGGGGGGSQPTFGAPTTVNLVSGGSQTITHTSGNERYKIIIGNLGNFNTNVRPTMTTATVSNIVSGEIRGSGNTSDANQAIFYGSFVSSSSGFEIYRWRIGAAESFTWIAGDTGWITNQTGVLTNIQPAGFIELDIVISGDVTFGNQSGGFQTGTMTYIQVT